MNRRDFLKKMGIGAAAVVLPGAVIGAIKPKTEELRFGKVENFGFYDNPKMEKGDIFTIGADPEQYEVTETSQSGNKLTTIDEIAREALLILEDKLRALGKI